MKQPQLNSFEIIKFNGEQDVKINFSGNRKVLIAENGSGKTTILNMLYLCLTNKLDKLKEYDFKECILTFQSNHKISIKAIDLQKIDGETAKLLERKISNIDDIKVINFLSAINLIAEDIFEKKGRRFFQEFILHYFSLIHNYHGIFPENKILENLIDYLQDDFNIITTKIFSSLELLSSMTKEDLDSVYIFLQEDNFDRKILSSIRISTHRSMTRNIFNKEIHFLLLEYLRIFSQRNDGNHISTEKLLNDLNIIFLPTYRRIENKLEELFDNNTLRENSNINFGLDDVLSLFKMIKKNIDDYTTKQLAELNNNILSDIINDKKVSSSRKDKLKDKTYISDILNILKDISEKDKKKLLTKIDNNNQNNNDYLFLYLDKLSNICELRDKISQDIINFIEVCNKYLVNKYFDYDKSSLEIKIKLKKGGKLIDLSSLSSGEKQIISLFAKLYIHHLSNPNLNDDEKKQYWIIFDEPELSLSMEWQRMLLEDIWKSGRCGFIFSTTHSPFIFDNEFRFYTSHINECLTEL